MKRFEDLNYYEMLEIPVNASPFEVSQAYKDALSIYHEDSLITYSFFDDHERDLILKRIEEAFLTLIDHKKRSNYNRMLVNEGKVDSKTFTEAKKKPIPLFQTNTVRNKEMFTKKIDKQIEKNDIQMMSDELFSKEIISGIDLKKLRESLGIDLEEVFEVTRINVTILKAIEENRFENLPPLIYLKNFLKTYAEILKLDSNLIVDGYIKNMEAHPEIFDDP
jgi:DnaJ-class molecular chaperone